MPCLQGFPPGSGLDLDEDTAAIEHRDWNPADGDKSDRIEKSGKSLVWHDVHNRSVEQLLEVYAGVRMDAAEG